MPPPQLSEWQGNKATQGLEEQMELQASQTCDKDFIISLAHTPFGTSLSERPLLSRPAAAHEVNDSYGTECKGLVLKLSRLHKSWTEKNTTDSLFNLSAYIKTAM